MFDQFTGATITPRAVVKAVKKATLYFKDHKKSLLTLPNSCLLNDLPPQTANESKNESEASYEH